MPSAPSSVGGLVRDADSLPVLEIVRDGSDAPQPHVSRAGKAGSREGLQFGKAFAVIVTFAVVGVAAGFSMRAFTARQSPNAPTSQEATPVTPSTFPSIANVTTPRETPPAVAEPTRPALAAAVMTAPVTKLPPPPAPAATGAIAPTRGSAVVTNAKPARVVVHGVARTPSARATRPGATPTAGKVHPRPAIVKAHRSVPPPSARAATRGGQSAHTANVPAKKAHP